MNVRAKQLSAVERMLRLESPMGGGAANGSAASGGTGAGPNLSQQWKVLIYDAACRDIISPLMTVGKLRENGVTLHMLLESPRESIPEVPAVYFFEPTEANIQRFVQDCEKQLYDAAYLNFSSPISKSLMDLLARRLVEINAVGRVAKVYDQYLGFVSLEPHLFSLNLRDSFVKYNSPALPDTAIEESMRSMATGALSLVATLGAVPIIRCPPGGPAEMVARQVNEMLQNLLQNQAGFLSQNAGRGVLEQRPMLLIVDRSVDLGGPLLHTAGYQNLVDDVLDFGLNRVRIPEASGAEGGNNVGASGAGANKSNGKVVTLDKDTDSFWAEYAGSMISTAVETHKQELASAKQQEERIKQQTGRDLSSFKDAEDSGTSSLLGIVQSLPELNKKKETQLKHGEVLVATMGVVSRRKLHMFVEPEEQMVFSQYADKKAVLQLASDAQLSLEDKVRFLAVYILYTSPSQQDVDEVKQAMVAAAETESLDQTKRDELLHALEYVRKILSLTRFGAGGGDAGASTSAQTGGGGLWDIASLTKTALHNASRQVKSMVADNKVMAAVRLMDLACREATSEAQIAEQDAQLLYLDPKVKGEVASHARIRAGFNRGVLFVVGGGCFAEYNNLQDYATGKLSVKSTLPLGVSSSSSNRTQKTYIYGCSELVNASRFMQQLAKCIS
ncbi:Sec1 family domain-containing protein 1 [Hondaea fermentalgiana]|uniref:Sec1 family domain-containing protein 1 n=1 Tax=Hondaea fermentalgiana TaxID=2315210 RepID=A0A2R5GJ39_9STRA|nr:Sec1 family domain-containing protein 1 [Hondaea fermentalgiana]|eukprot:GBG30907.1 Sec1 family domain-containing protein 1 [Hondaea fermentalgiana]